MDELHRRTRLSLQILEKETKKMMEIAGEILDLRLDEEVSISIICELTDIGKLDELFRLERDKEVMDGRIYVEYYPFSFYAEFVIDGVRLLRQKAIVSVRLKESDLDLNSMMSVFNGPKRAKITMIAGETAKIENMMEKTDEDGDLNLAVETLFCELGGDLIGVLTSKLEAEGISFEDELDAIIDWADMENYEYIAQEFDELKNIVYARLHPVPEQVRPRVKVFGENTSDNNSGVREKEILDRMGWNGPPPRVFVNEDDPEEAAAKIAGIVNGVIQNQQDDDAIADIPEYVVEILNNVMSKMSMDDMLSAMEGSGPFHSMEEIMENLVGGRELDEDEIKEAVDSFGDIIATVMERLVTSPDEEGKANDVDLIKLVETLIGEETINLILDEDTTTKEIVEVLVRATETVDNTE